MGRKRTNPETVRRRRCVELYRRLGCHVIDTSSPIPTYGARGVPDLLVFCPRAPAGQRFWLHEVKTPTGKLTLEQRKVGEVAQACEEIVEVDEDGTVRGTGRSPATLKQTAIRDRTGEPEEP